MIRKAVSGSVKPVQMMERPSKLYILRIAVLQSGERLPMLTDAATGIPLIEPTQYILRAKRPTCEVATLTADLRNIAILYAWSTARGLDILERIRENGSLRRNELESLIEAARLDFRPTDQNNPEESEIPLPVIAQPTWANRLITIRDYICWQIDELIGDEPLGSLRRQHLLIARTEFVTRINAGIPDQSVGSRTGLQPNLRERLWQIVDPASPLNPFQECLRYRNFIIIEWLSKLGFRRGELLKIKTSNVTTSFSATVQVTRERDDVEDPRRHEPRAKTESRRIPISIELARLTDQYLLAHRNKVPGAKRTPFLFLARNGEPLSLEGLRSVLRQIINRYPEFKGLLSPHVLRHTAADLYWGFIRDHVDSESERVELINFLMGWASESDQSAKYAAGEIARRATDLSLQHQQMLFKPLSLPRSA